MRIINKTKNTVLAKEVIIASSLFRRMKGLLGRKGLGPGEAMVLQPCNSVHSFFMRFSIDILFIDKNNKVVRTILAFKPFCISSICFLADSAIELPIGTIQATGTATGDTIILE